MSSQPVQGRKVGVLPLGVRKKQGPRAMGRRDKTGILTLHHFSILNFFFCWVFSFSPWRQPCCDKRTDLNSVIVRENGTFGGTCPTTKGKAIKSFDNKSALQRGSRQVGGGFLASTSNLTCKM